MSLDIDAGPQPGWSGIQWKEVTFNPNDSLGQKWINYLSCGIIPYESPTPILNNAYGHVRLGELTALMGPSGAGKSSLLNCLTEGICNTGFGGYIESIGIPEKIRASILHQDEKEHLNEELTVFETLMYASQLKNRKWCAPFNFHESNVVQLLRQLGLANKAHNPVGKCSGGERKRLAIGLELAEEQKPHVLFLDEPTTGLDSSVAFTVVKVLAALAKENNMAIVATIHQPNEEILGVFNKAIMLSGTGDVVYQGSPSIPELRSFLGDFSPIKENNVRNPLRCFHNPGDDLIGFASALKRGGDNGSLPHHRALNFKEYFDNVCMKLGYQRVRLDEQQGDQRPIFEPSVFESDIAQRTSRRMISYNFDTYTEVGNRNCFRRDYSRKGILCRSYSFGSYLTCFGFWTLVKRTWRLRVVTAWQTLLLRLLIYLGIVWITTGFYHREIGKDANCVILEGQPGYPDLQNCPCQQTEAQIQAEPDAFSNVKLIFFFLLFISLESLFNVVLTFPKDFKLFIHEFQNGWYSSPAFFFSKVLVEMPPQLIISTAYAVYFYLYTEQEDFSFLWGHHHSQPPGGNATTLAYNLAAAHVKGERFKIYLRASLLGGFIAQGIGFLIGILCVNNNRQAILLSIGSLLGLTFFCGFFKKRVHMTDTESFLTTFSFLRYGLETMVIAIYGKERCESPYNATMMISYGLKDEDIEGNWIGFFKLLLITWTLTFLMLQLKASKWYPLKVVRRGLLLFLQKREGRSQFQIEDGVVRAGRCARCINAFRNGLRSCLGFGWKLAKWIITTGVILGAFLITGYILVADFIGAWS